MGADARIAELGLELPTAPKPVAVYRPAVRHGDLLYVSGHGPLKPDRTMFTGRVGAEVDLETAQLAARQVGLAILATLRSELGSLDRVVRLVKSLALVNSTDDFTDQPLVVNGYSELMRDVFGEPGIGARSAMAANTLPGGISVEIEAIFQVRD